MPKLLTDAELEQLMLKMITPHLQEFKAGHTDILLSSFVELINGQKKAHAAMVIGYDSNPDGFDEDFPTAGMLEDIRLDAENQLRAEQRERNQ